MVFVAKTEDTDLRGYLSLIAKLLIIHLFDQS